MSWDKGRQRRIENAHSSRFKNASLGDWEEHLDDCYWGRWDWDWGWEEFLDGRGNVSLLSRGEPESLLAPVNGKWAPLLVSCWAVGPSGFQGCVGLFSSRALAGEMARLFSPQPSSDCVSVSPMMVKCAQKSLAERLAEATQERVGGFPWGQDTHWREGEAVGRELEKWPFRCLWVNFRLGSRVKDEFMEAPWIDECETACSRILGAPAHWVGFEGAGYPALELCEEPAFFVELLMGEGRREKKERRALFAAMGSVKKPVGVAAPRPARKTSRL